jgi:PKD repeat protein
MRKRFQKYYYLLFSILVIASCSPDLPLPQPNSGEVVFLMTGEINGEIISFAAGEGNRYMYTSHETDSSGVLLFQGTLGEVGCQYCSNSLHFEFAQADGNTTTDALFSTTIAPTLNYRNALISMEITGYDVRFEMSLSGTAPFNLTWDFDDSTPVVNTSSTIFEHEYTEAGTYNVCANITDATGCQSMICRTIATDNSMNCSINFSVFHVAGLNYFFHPFSSGVPPFNYQWSIPDSLMPQTSTLSSPTILMNQIGTMPITASMTDSKNCSSSIVQLVDFNNPNGICLNHFDYQSKPIFTPGIAANYFSTFAIKHIDENGVIYSSALGEQPTFSVINILGIEDFLINENNQPTKKITLEMSCRLFAANGNYVDLTNGFGTIAIAHQD